MSGLRQRNPLISALGGLYAYIYCMMASNTLTGMPVFGGALYMCGQVAIVFVSTYVYRHQHLSPAAGKWHGVLLALMMLMNLCVLVVYPISFASPSLWILFVLVATIILKDAICQHLVHRTCSGQMSHEQYVLLMALVYMSTVLVMAVVLLYNVQGGLALLMLGGYVLCSLMDAYSFHKTLQSHQEETVQGSTEMIHQVQQTIRQANTYKSFTRLSTLVCVALEMTLVVMYTYLAVTAQQQLICMVLALLTTFLAREGTEIALRRSEKRQESDPTNMMLMSLLIWFFGLWLFDRALQGGSLSMTYAYICLGLCSVGSTMCDTYLQRMEQAVANAARFASGDDAPGYVQMRRAGQELAQLLGQMLALGTLTIMCFLGRHASAGDMTAFALRFQPVMVLPALLTVLLAMLSVMGFPLSKRQMNKLARFLHLRETGGDNPSLKKQLEEIVVKRHRQPLVIRAIMALLRPFFRHTLKGEENIVQDENNPIVFLCNHGEIYGPVSAMLYIPVPVRPWSISDMMISAEEVSRYIYKWTFSPIKWLGPARWWISRLIGPIAVWGMKHLEAIPVYRNKPRELMTTFRKSVEAMEAGDNLVIFPENPDAVEGAGYAQGCMGELYRGFPMLAQVYYNRTGKRCRFLPMYAHKGMRTLSFGEPLLFDPDNETIVERDRIVDEATRQMRALFEREEALYQAKKNQ